jgi:hypothetical protein
MGNYWRVSDVRRDTRAAAAANGQARAVDSTGTSCRARTGRPSTASRTQPSATQAQPATIESNRSVREVSKKTGAGGGS